MFTKLNRFQALSFNVYGEGVESVAFSRAVHSSDIKANSSLAEEINEVKFDFKTNIEKSLHITYPSEFLSEKKNPLVLFLLEPKFKFSKPSASKGIATFDSSSEKARVYIETQIVRLEPFTKLEGTIGQGEFKYFKVEVNKPEDFSVILSINKGEAELFAQNHADNLPTLRRYWKKSQSMKGDTLSVSADDQKDTHIFLFGVYGRDLTQFTLLFMPGFHNVIKISFQKLVDLELSANQSYFFDFYNNRSVFSTMLYADGADVEVACLDLDKNEHEDFATKIADENSFFPKDPGQRRSNPSGTI